MMAEGWKIKRLNIFYFFLLLFGKVRASTAKNIKQNLLEILMNKTYASPVRPDAETGLPTIVTVDLFLESAGEMDYMKQIPVALIVSESWTDSRLNISHWDKGKVVFHENMIHLFWTPKLYLVSTEGMKQDKFTQKIIVKPNGDIMLLQRNILNLLCQKSLSTFPLDGQICGISLKSFYYNVDELVLRWNSKTDFKQSVSVLEIPNFYLKEISLAERNITQFGAHVSLLDAEISLGRKMSLRIMAVYLTSTFLVIIAWLSFWVDYQATAARISLGLITLLTLITHNSNLVPHSPAKEFLSTDIKGLDIWLTVCLGFVFFALVEFILLNYCLTKKASQKKKPSKLPSVISLISQRKLKSNTEDISPNNMVTEREVAEYKIADDEQKNILNCCKQSKLPQALDKYCRVLFLLAFILFNIIYWVGQTY